MSTSPDVGKIRVALKLAHGNMTKAAKYLQMPRSTAWDRLHGGKKKKPKNAPSSPSIKTDEEVRSAREKDSQLLRLGQKFSDEKKKRTQAELDLEKAKDRLQMYAATALDPTLFVRPKQVASPGEKTSSIASVVISCADWHIGAMVNKEEVDSLNQFNLEIAHNRIGRLWSKISRMVEHTRHITNVDEIVLWLGGDFLSGSLHDLPEKNEIGVVDAIKFVQKHLVEGITLLSQIAGIGRILIPTSRGNHGRSTTDFRIATAVQNSWEQIIYDNLAITFAEDCDVSVINSSSPFNYLDISGLKARFTHGDLIRYQGGIMGVGVPIMKAISKWDANRHADMTFLGHYHQSTWARRYIMTGSLIGVDQYALSIGAAAESPSQQFTVIDRRRGRVTQSLPLFLEDA